MSRKRLPLKILRRLRKLRRRCRVSIVGEDDHDYNNDDDDDDDDDDESEEAAFENPEEAEKAAAPLRG